VNKHQSVQFRSVQVQNVSTQE